jgi:hypothetical protein
MEGLLVIGPVIGSHRWHFASFRFCAFLGDQLDAGVDSVWISRRGQLAMIRSSLDGESAQEEYRIHA